MLDYLLLILLCQLIGETAVTIANIPFPGPVVGMLILFAYLVVRGSVPTQLGQVANTLLSHLSLLFVPAGVGVILHFKLLGEDFFPLTVATVVSTLLTIVVSGLMMSALNRRTKGEHPRKEQS